MSKISTVTNQAIQAGFPPANLDRARQALGEKAYIGLCEKFVENAGGKDAQFASASAAWNGQQGKAVKGSLNGIQPGDEVYFAPDKSNENYGHTGIYAGNGQFISATDNGIKQVDLGSWIQQTGQILLGYVKTTAGDIASSA